VSGPPRRTADLGGPEITYRAFALLILLSALLSLGANGAGGRISGPSRVGLVVDMGDGALVTRCVVFSEAEISGLDVLERSGLEVVTSEGAVCAIEGVGCPASNCWCQCQGSPCIYWSYWHWLDGEWQYSQAGAAGYWVHDGDVEGWRWGESATPSSIVPFEQICFPFRVYLPVILHSEI
jgi:hypothetical protein